MSALEIELTVFTKEGGPLTKTIRLGPDGEATSNSSDCKMARGRAERVRVRGVEGLADLISSLRSDQAIALGTLRSDLPDAVTVTTMSELNGARIDFIARTTNSIVYRKDEPAFGLFDWDTKGMPPEVKAAVAAAGGDEKSRADDRLP